jgi:hypothetical protein
LKSLTVQANSNEAFKMRIMKQIEQKRNAMKKFLIPERPFSDFKWLESAYESGRFSDLRLIAGTGKVFKAHKLVLAGKFERRFFILQNHALLMPKSTIWFKKG